MQTSHTVDVLDFKKNIPEHKILGIEYNTLNEYTFIILLFFQVWCTKEIEHWQIFYVKIFKTLADLAFLKKIFGHF